MTNVVFKLCILMYDDIKQIINLDRNIDWCIFRLDDQANNICQPD